MVAVGSGGAVFNGDSVPCESSNDAADSGGAPIACAGNVDGTCGATDAMLAAPEAKAKKE
ncbi:MAG: hypothetical protein WBN82_00965 [Porticoccaceae bacterium]